MNSAVERQPGAAGIILTLVCPKCTRAASFHGTGTRDAGSQAERKGWRRVNGKTICPKCPK